uniref:Protein kinase domain-containing protein n=1 Tax=Glossina morsitans morsitans TaxID=37546 RepID=A0A240SWU4_GLOMM
MKGIEKPSSNSPTQNIFLPQHIRCMLDYIHNYGSNCKISESMDKLSPELNNENIQNNRSNRRDKENKNSSMDIEDIKAGIVIRDSQQAVVIRSHDEEPFNLQSNRLLRLDEASIKQWARELLIAIHSSHGRCIILGDLHSKNILLGDKGQQLLTYFYQNDRLCSNSYAHKDVNSIALAGQTIIGKAGSDINVSERQIDAQLP